MDWTALGVTTRLAFCTTLILAAGGIPLAYWLANTRFRGKALVEAVVSVPLVLPPTVLGVYLLFATGTRSPFGRWFESLFGARLPFTFWGLLLGSVLFNLPFAVRPFAASFASVDRRLREASWCLGASKFETFRRVSLPLALPGVLAGITLTFAHSIGEFGVALMIGGSIPGVTRTLSIAIYDDVQTLEFVRAAQTSLALVVFALVALLASSFLERRGHNR